MIKRLRIKLILISMLSLICVLAVIMAAINILSYKGAIDEADEILALISDNEGRFPMLPGIEPPFDIDSPELPYESRFFSVTYSREGDIISVMTDNIAAVDKQMAMHMANEALKAEQVRGFYDNYRYFVDVRGMSTRVVFLDCTRVLDTHHNFLTISMLISGAGLVVVFILILILSGIAIRPVADSIEKQKRFISDAGHELKTPLTIIDADAELIEMEGGGSEWLDDIRAQVKRLSTLTGDLIYLSRMEEESFALPFVEFPLSDVVHESALAFSSIAKTKGKELIFNIERMVSMVGDERSISQLVSLLVDNALKYSVDNSRIELSLKRSGKSVILTVSNITHGVSKEKLDHFFDRFWRADASRSERDGYGLGLSVASAIVLAHKGRIIATSPDEKRIDIIVMLPLS